MGIEYVVEACIKTGKLADVRTALVNSGVRTRFVNEVRGIYAERWYRNSDLVRGRVHETDLHVLLYVIVNSEELAGKVADLIRQNATAGNPNDDGWVMYRRADCFQPITE